MMHQHILLVAYPAQGHINPALQFANRLIKLGIEVTIATSKYAQSLVNKASGTQKGFNFAAIPDGYADGFRPNGFDVQHLTALRKHGLQTLKDVICRSARKCPVTCIVYTLLLTWAAEVACDCHIQSALLWIQPATVLDIYYYYFNGYEEDIKNNGNDPAWSVQIPGLPSLFSSELPSFLLPSSTNVNNSALLMFKEQFEVLDAQEKPTVLVNTFDAMEPHALKAIEKYNTIGIGPLVPSGFFEGHDSTNPSFVAEFFKKSENYIEWLGSRPKLSVVYVSFGSLLKPSKLQMEEIAKGLIECGRSFLWVIRDDEKLSCMEELKQIGKIVPWCSQMEILTHPSLGCFITHCGWNSTLESMVCGVPVIAFPQWTDQGTNAKLIQDVWGMGIKVTTNVHGVVESDEIKRCIQLIMDGGGKKRELRNSSKKWKMLALEALQDGGSSDKNLKGFLAEEIGLDLVHSEIKSSGAKF